jgi:predicted nucleotidyltransferase
MKSVLAERVAEQRRLIALARAHVDGLAQRIRIVQAAVVGSVARGDFNVWSDVDVIVVAEGLPESALDRLELLMADRPPRVEVIGYTRSVPLTCAAHLIDGVLRIGLAGRSRSPYG